jgi:hypothetical protein
MLPTKIAKMKIMTSNRAATLEKEPNTKDKSFLYANFYDDNKK